ncbi:hypothetical protein MKW92_032012 [Papaver armeniacum]|nr:hypothetical protein MKW92_032012 [Papaver armeniacum]
MVFVKKEFSLQSSRTDDFWSNFILGTTPRQQVIDAQVLSDFVCKLSLSIKTFRNKTSPTDFITCMLHKYGEKNSSNQSRSLKWNEIGIKKIAHVYF